MAVGGERHAPDALPPRKRTVTCCTGGWVDPRAIWTVAGSKTCLIFYLYVVFCVNIFFFLRAVACPNLSICLPVSCHYSPSSVYVSLFLTFSVIHILYSRHLRSHLSCFSPFLIGWSRCLSDHIDFHSTFSRT